MNKKGIHIKDAAALLTIAMKIPVQLRYKLIAGRK